MYWSPWKILESRFTGSVGWFPKRVTTSPNASQSLLQPDNTRSWQSEWKPCETTDGRLRFARRGEKLSFMFSEGDSEIFRLFHSETVPRGSIERDGIRLHAFSTGVGTCQVAWKNLDFAERNR